MEDLKDRILFIILVIVVSLIFGFTYYFLGIKENYFYTKVDNDKIEQILSNDDMKYMYTLDCYNEKGRKEQIKFKTNRQLRQDTYLMLEVINIRRCTLLEGS